MPADRQVTLGVERAGTWTSGVRASCTDCGEFHDDTTRGDIRKARRWAERHVRATGHSVGVEFIKSDYYEPVSA